MEKTYVVVSGRAMSRTKLLEPQTQCSFYIRLINTCFKIKTPIKDYTLALMCLLWSKMLY